MSGSARGLGPWRRPLTAAARPEAPVCACACASMCGGRSWGANTESPRLTQQSAGSVTGMKGCSVSEVAWQIKSQRIRRRDVALL